MADSPETIKQAGIQVVVTGRKEATKEFQQMIDFMENSPVEVKVDLDFKSIENALKDIKNATENIKNTFYRDFKVFNFHNLQNSLDNVKDNINNVTSSFNIFKDSMKFTDKGSLKVYVSNLSNLSHAADALYESLIKIEEVDGKQQKFNKFDDLLKTLKEIKGITEQISSGLDLGEIAPLSKITKDIAESKKELESMIQVTDKTQSKLGKLGNVLSKNATKKKAMQVINEGKSEDVIISQKALDSLNEYIHLGGDLSKLSLENGRTMLDFANVLKNEGVLDKTSEDILNLTNTLSKLDVERQKAEKRQNGIEINFNQETLDKFASSMSKMSEQMGKSVGEGMLLGMKPEDLEKITSGINDIKVAVESVAEILESGIDVNKINSALEVVETKAKEASTATEELGKGTSVIKEKTDALNKLADAEERVVEAGTILESEPQKYNFENFFDTEDDVRRKYIDFLKEFQKESEFYGTNLFTSNFGLDVGYFESFDELKERLTEVNSEFSKLGQEDELKVKSLYVLELSKALGIVNDDVKDLEGCLRHIEDYGMNGINISQIAEPFERLIEKINSLKILDFVSKSNYGDSPYKKSYDEIKADKEKPNQSPTASSRAFDEERQTVEKTVTAEQEALGRLQETIRDTALTVDSKTNAFRQEKEVVDGVIQSEIINLQVLSGWISNVITDLEKIQKTPINTKIEGISISQEDISNIKNDLETVEQKINGLFDTKNISDWSKKFGDELSSISTKLEKFKDEIKVNVDDATMNSFTTKSGELVTNLTNIVNELKTIATVINSIDPAVLKAVNSNKGKGNGNGKGKQQTPPTPITLTAATETEAKALRDLIKNTKTYVNILGEELDIKKQIRTVNGEQKESFYVSGKDGNTITFGKNNDPLNANIKGISDLTAKKELDKQIERNRKQAEKLAKEQEKAQKRNEKLQQKAKKRQVSKATSDSMSDTTKAKNALKEQIKAYQNIVELKDKILKLNPNTDKEQITNLKSQLKEQQRSYYVNEQILKQYRNIITKEEQINELKKGRLRIEESIRAKEEKQANKNKNSQNKKAESDKKKTITQQQNDWNKNTSQGTKKAENALDKQITVYEKLLRLKNERSKLNPNTDKEQIAKLDTEIAVAKQNFEINSDIIKQYRKFLSFETQYTALKQARLKVAQDIRIEEEKQANAAKIKSDKDYLGFGVTKDWFNKYRTMSGWDLRKSSDAFRTKVQTELGRLDGSQIPNLFDKLLDGSIEKDELNKLQDVVNLIKKLQDDMKLDENKAQNQSSYFKLLGKMQDYQQKISGASEETRQHLKAMIDELEHLGKSGTKEDIARLSSVFFEFTTNTKKAGEEVASFFDIIKNKAMYQSAEFFARYFSMQDIYMYAQRAFEIAKDYDTALTEMRKVSNETVGSLRDFQKETFDTGNAIGTTAKQVQDSTAEWLRLGESFEQAKESAVDTTILFNVSEFDSIDQATESLISMSQAYKDLEKMDIINIVNKVGNEFSASTSELSEGLQRSAAVLSTQGNDLAEAVALLTAGDAITQDMDSTSAGVRTIALRIAGTEEAKEELESLGESVDDYVVQTKSKTDEIIRNYTAVASNMGKGVSVLNDNGNLRNTYQILLDISKVYREIQEEDKKYGTNRAAALVEALANSSLYVQKCA